MSLNTNAAQFSPAKRAIIIGMDGASMELVKNVIDGSIWSNRSFLLKMVKIWSFWGQNDVIGQNFGKVVTKILL